MVCVEAREPNSWQLFLSHARRHHDGLVMAGNVIFLGVGLEAEVLKATSILHCCLYRFRPGSRLGVKVSSHCLWLEVRLASPEDSL